MTVRPTKIIALSLLLAVHVFAQTRDAPRLARYVDPFVGTGGPSKLLNLGAFAAPCNWDPTAGACAGGFHFGNLGRNAFVALWHLQRL